MKKRLDPKDLKVIPISPLRHVRGGIVIEDQIMFLGEGEPSLAESDLIIEDQIDGV